MKKSLRWLSLLTALVLALLPVSSATADWLYERGNWKFTVLSSEAKLMEYTGPGGVVVLPEYVSYNSDDLTATVTAHDAEMFDGYQGTLTGVVYSPQISTVIQATFENFAVLESVSLPGGLSTIGIDAFRNCISLQSVNAGGVSTIGSGAFAGCTSLSTIDLTSLKHLQGNTFSGCSSLQKITFGDLLTRVNATAFIGTPITELALPGSVTMVEGSFGGSSLTHIELPDSVTDLAGAAFTDLAGQLEYLRWPAGKTSVQGTRFRGFTALKTVILPEGVKNISRSYDGDRGAFLGCTGLTSMEFPNSLEIIGLESFMDCTSLSSVSFGSGLKQILNRAFANTALTVVYLPAGVTKVAADAFPEGCVIICPGGSTTAATLTGAKIDYTTPTALDLPADLTAIEAGAFIGADAEMVIIPAGCTSIGSRAFANMPNLRYVQLPEGTSVAEDAFAGCGTVEFIDY